MAMDTWLPNHAKAFSRTLLLPSKSRNLIPSFRVGLLRRGDRFFPVVCLVVLALAYTWICLLFRSASRDDNEASWLAPPISDSPLKPTVHHDTIWAASSGISQTRLPLPYGNLRFTFLHASVFGDGDTEKFTLEFLTMLEGKLVHIFSDIWRLANAALHVFLLRLQNCLHKKMQIVGNSLCLRISATLYRLQAVVSSTTRQAQRC